MDPAIVKEHFDRIGCFRVLVMGRSNAGKTTILQRVCNTTDLPEVFNSKGEKRKIPFCDTKCANYSQRGYHSIEDELIFKSNRGFIFHDSRGFESGSENEMEVVRDFVADRATTLKLEKRIHAIWFCIPMTDYERAIMAAEEKFFNECNMGSVPVIVLLTKTDFLVSPAIGQLIDEGLSMKEAKLRAGDLAEWMLNYHKTRIINELDGLKCPPKDYLTLANMNQDDADCHPLLRCTTNALGDIELQQLLISTQQTNLVLNIECIVEK
ncbi:hypothetical protein V8B97DRAFT_1866773 [Scleroderma yunnanense]